VDLLDTDYTAMITLPPVDPPVGLMQRTRLVVVLVACVVPGEPGYGVVPGGSEAVVQRGDLRHLVVMKGVPVAGIEIGHPRSCPGCRRHPVGVAVSTTGPSLKLTSLISSQGCRPPSWAHLGGPCSAAGRLSLSWAICWSRCGPSHLGLAARVVDLLGELGRRDTGIQGGSDGGAGFAGELGRHDRVALLDRRVAGRDRPAHVGRVPVERFVFGSGQARGILAR
jgi:hypothetical protein